MKIGGMFKRDINRNINGVVKVNQTDLPVVFQELDEYVVTKELLAHFRKFFSAYGSSISSPTDKMGVWVSGFFGSGKSHFIKVLSYLLENRDVVWDDLTCKPIEFFEDKVTDATVLADMKRAITTDTDVVLFNIDSKADVHDADHRDSILKVFMKVFDEAQGFCAEIPELAEMERFLTQKGLYDSFRACFRERTGDVWEEARDTFRLMPEDGLEAFAKTTNQSVESAQKWFEGAEAKYSLSIEKFARLVREYLDAKGPQHRIIFLVDEVGQYIGQNTQLMLNLQTIVENLGTECKGRAWVLVTSQEDMDAILGEMRASKANDFSKIQGRFTTRLSLSSANTDEVIKRRLLDKTREAASELKVEYQRSKDILKNQLSFTADGATMRTYASSGDFVDSYPFIPYQFDLLQKVFESIRKVGATGAHLARGERSMLDSFQQATRAVQQESTGVLLPFHSFYEAIEGFLETIVVRTVERAGENPSLDHFDQCVLKTLFLIRYVDLIPGNIENLATLCVTGIDEDKLELKRRIAESLTRLEKETLVQRNGDLYSFLTNEERDVMNEIKGVDLDHTEQVQLVSDILFLDILKDRRKHRLSVNGKDYEFSRSCDGVYRGTPNGDISIEVVTPFNDDYEGWNTTRCIMQTAEGNGKIIFRVKDDPMLAREVAQYKRTEKFVLQKDQTTVPPSIRRILQDHSAENRARRKRIQTKLEDLFAVADVYTVGKLLPIAATQADAVLREAVEYLITNTYRKLDFLVAYCADPEKEIQSMMKSHAASQLVLDLDDENRHPNYRAFEEIQEYLRLKFLSNEKVVLKDLAERYNGRPWGWPLWDTVVMASRLFRCGEIRLLCDGGLLDFQSSVEQLTKTRNWAKVILQKEKVPDEGDRKKALELAKECFHQIPPSDAEDLAIYIREKVAGTLQDMDVWQKEAGYANYPTQSMLETHCKVLHLMEHQKTTADLLHAVAKAEDDLRDFAEDLPLLQSFHKTQKTVFDQGRSFVQAKAVNSSYYADDGLAAWQDLQRIMTAPSPFAQIPKIKGLVASITKHDSELLGAKREKALPAVRKRLDQLALLADKMDADEGQKRQALAPLEALVGKTEETDSIDAIVAVAPQSQSAFERSLQYLESLKEDKRGGEPSKPVSKVCASDFASGPYLETEEQVETFVQGLRSKLREQIQAGKRVQIQ
jgi:hypothetical protein